MDAFDSKALGIATSMPLLSNGPDHCIRVVVNDLQQNPGWPSWRAQALLPVTESTQ